MSIVASVKVYDGIVLAAESMTQLFTSVGGQAQHIKSYPNAKKLFQIEDLPIGVLTYGAGNIGNRSVESFLHEFSMNQAGNLRKGLTVAAAANALLEFMRSYYDAGFGHVDADKRPVMGFFVAGYSEGQHLGSEWEFSLPQASAAVEVRPDDKLGASWRGIHVPFTRLFWGLDPRMDGILLANGVAEDVVKRVREQARPQLMLRVPFDGMPIQDAIDFCLFIIRTTIGASRFEVGVPSCGGPIHVAVITKSDNFKWINRPEYTVNEKD